MSINKPYKGSEDLPGALPIFPLPGALLLPRGELPLNIFEPRYLAMIDDVLKANRLIVMIQPALKADATQEPPPLEAIGCAGRLTQFAETGDGRYMLALTGIARCRIRSELSVMTPYRQCEVDFAEFSDDFAATDAIGVDRGPILQTLRKFADANKLRIDWDEAKTAPIEILVNALSMMSPFGPGEKQALLEARDLKTRADVLIAITEIELARRDAPRHLQ